MARFRPLRVVVIREELAELTGGGVKAAILNQFIYWTEKTFDFDKWLSEEQQRALKTFGADAPMEFPYARGWFEKSAADMHKECQFMADVSTRSVRRYMDELVEHGWVAKRHNPKHKRNRAFQYRVDILKVIVDLHALGYALPGYSLLKQIVFTDEELKQLANAFDTVANGRDYLANPSAPVANPCDTESNVLIDYTIDYSEEEGPPPPKNPQDGNIPIEHLAGEIHPERVEPTDADRYFEYRDEVLKIYLEAWNQHPNQARKDLLVELAAQPGFDLEQWREWVRQYNVNGGGPYKVQQLIDGYWEFVGKQPQQEEKEPSRGSLLLAGIKTARSRDDVRVEDDGSNICVYWVESGDRIPREELIEWGRQDE